MELLFIDFRYTKIFCFSPVLQAATNGTLGSTNAAIALAMSLGAGDREFIKNIKMAAEEILAAVLQISAKQQLKFVPVRIYVRVVSACIFLLKVCTKLLGLRNLRREMSNREND
jgi:hypothetical protein